MTRGVLPGPRAPALLQTLRWLWMTPAAMERMAGRYGDLFRVRLLMPRHPGDVTRWRIDPTDVVIVHSPALIRDVFAAGPELSGGEGRRFTATVFGERSLLVLDGEAHREERRRLLTLFAPERLARYQELIGEAAAAALDRWPAGRAELGPLVNRLVIESAMRFVFGSPSHPTVLKIWGLMEQVGDLPDWSPPMLFFPPLRRAAARWKPGVRTPVLLGEVREALAALAPGADPDTLFGQILRLESPGADDPVAWRLARVLGVMAGFDTTAVAAQWAIHQLLQHPAALARARDDPEYLEAACKEAARLQPAVPILVRRVVSPCRFGGYDLAPGSFLVPCVYIAHHRPEQFPAPLAFRPERFLERSFAGHEFLPFGGGSRRCIGQAIAFRQMAIVLGALLRRHELKPLRPFRDGIGRRAVVMTPRDPMPVILRPITGPRSAGSETGLPPLHAGANL